jgi:hypothetical protein
MANKPSTYDSVMKFLHKHRIQGKQVYMRQIQQPSYHNYNYNFQKEYQSYYMQAEEVLAIEMTMPLKALEDLVETHDEVERLKTFYGPDALNRMGEAEDILYKNRKEEYARRLNPAVQKAWDNYQLLLRIAGE